MLCWNNLPLSQYHPSQTLGVGFFRKSAILSVGGYHQFFITAEDVDLILRLQEKYAVGYTPDYLYQLREHDGERLQKHPMLNFYSICAIVSAYCRRNNMPCPIKQKKDILDIVSMMPSMFDSEPPEFRNANFYKKNSQILQKKHNAKGKRAI